MINSISGHGLQSFHSSPSLTISSQTGGIDNKQLDDSQTQGGTSAAEQNPTKVTATSKSEDSQTSKNSTQDNKTPSTNNSPVELSEEEIKQVQALKQRDIEVRAHEAAHLAAAGQHAQGGAKFTLKKGPDGRSYAVGGSVSIDTSPEATPEATIRKADQIKRAALAPAEPSGQDRSVAAQAVKMRLAAQAEIAQAERTEKQDSLGEGKGEGQDPTSANRASESQVSPSELASTAGIDQVKSAAKLLCEICSGEHPTGPHLQANQQKTAQYLSVSSA